MPWVNIKSKYSPISFEANCNKMQRITDYNLGSDVPSSSGRNFLLQFYSQLNDLESALREYVFYSDSLPFNSHHDHSQHTHRHSHQIFESNSRFLPVEIPAFPQLHHVHSHVDSQRCLRLALKSALIVPYSSCRWPPRLLCDSREDLERLCIDNPRVR